ncbi:MAG: hypothetical protein RI942_1491, partial [Pseudomonadota bacterium]
MLYLSQITILVLMSFLALLPKAEVADVRPAKIETDRYTRGDVFLSDFYRFDENLPQSPGIL